MSRPPLDRVSPFGGWTPELIDLACTEYEDRARELEQARQEAYAEGRKDEAEEHSIPLLESLRHVQTTLASNIAFDMDGVPETGWDAVAAFLLRDIDTAINATYPTSTEPA
jgi:hypothetical protein